MSRSIGWSVALSSWLFVASAHAEVGVPATRDPSEPAAAGSRDLTVEELGPEPRMALVLGNAAYANQPLKNPTNDASFMAAVLKKVGFTVTVGLNLSRDEMLKALNDFERQMRERPRGVALVFYAGHGVQHNGENYLIPLRATIDHPSDLDVEAVQLQNVYTRLHQAENRVNIVILDACRNNPFPSLNREVSRGLAPVGQAPEQSLIMYSTAPGAVAVDGEGELSAFTSSLANHVAEPGLVFDELFRGVVKDVQTSTEGRQSPWLNTSTTEAFYFVPTGVARPNLVKIQPIVPAPPEMPFDYRLAGWISGGAAVAAAIAGSVFGALALTTYNRAEDQCPSHKNCSESAINKGNSADTQATLSTIMFVTAGIGAGAAVTLFVLAPAEYEYPHGIGITLSPWGLHAAARF